MTGKPEVKFIRPPDLLRDRLQKMEGNKADFSAAKGVLQKLAPEFVARLPDELSNIQKA